MLTAQIQGKARTGAISVQALEKTEQHAVERKRLRVFVAESITVSEQNCDARIEFGVADQ